MTKKSILEPTEQSPQKLAKEDSVSPFEALNLRLHTQSSGADILYQEKKKQISLEIEAKNQSYQQKQIQRANSVQSLKGRCSLCTPTQKHMDELISSNSLRYSPIPNGDARPCDQYSKYKGIIQRKTKIVVDLRQRPIHTRLK